jgi:23S rRNA (pseudouridine1915-N3)-methyltransferase
VKLAVVLVGRSSASWADEAVANYQRRMRRWGGVSEIRVRKETFRDDVDAVRRQEGQRLLGAVAPRDRLVALDERGTAVDTRAFTGLIEACRQAGTSRLVFAVGGAYGLDAEVRDRAWKVVRLSDLVLNHDVARVVLHEQIYRAFTLIDRLPYHH